MVTFRGAQDTYTWVRIASLAILRHDLSGPGDLAMVSGLVEELSFSSPSTSSGTSLIKYKNQHLKMKGYMYILRCANSEYYTGSTNDLQKKMEEHNNVIACNFTWKQMPVELIYSEEFATVEEAVHREKQIKKWSRKKKEALISGDIELLKSLARSHTDIKKESIQKLLPGL